MGLKRKKSKNDIQPSTYSRDHIIFKQYNEKYCTDKNSSEKTGWDDALWKAAQRPRTLASKIAFRNENQSIEEILGSETKISDANSVRSVRSESKLSIIYNKPNYFLTISMAPCFNNKWNLYNRDYHVARLYQKVAVLIKKLFLNFDNSLAKSPYQEWPFFFGTMEHFDDEGNLVAPHMHILFSHEADIKSLTKLINCLWKEAMDRIGVTDIDLRAVDDTNLNDRAYYILKHSYSDISLDTNDGDNIERICRSNNWSVDSLSHDKWMINRDTLRNALKQKHDILGKTDYILSSGKPERKSIKQIHEIIFQHRNGIRTSEAHREQCILINDK